MSSGEFDFGAARRERKANAKPFVAVMPGKTKNFTFSALLPGNVGDLLATGQTSEFLATQLGSAEAKRFEKLTANDDPRTLNLFLGKYFEHMGLPNPYNEDGVLASSVLSQMGEALASKN